MSTFQITLLPHQLQSILVDELSNAVSLLLRELQDRRDGRYTSGIFHEDRVADIRMIKEHIDAANLMIQYYSIPSERDQIVTYRHDDRDTLSIEYEDS
jgi:hypothetical protein